jgi:peptide/nickel transport system permease protein
MSLYLFRRLLQVPLMLLGIVVFTFFLIHAAPGDPVVALAGEYGNQAYYDQMRAKFGLDRPLPEQLVTYLAAVARGDLGYSYSQGQPVMRIIMARVPTTLLLMLTAFAISTTAGIGLGLLAARRPHSVVDASVTAISLIGHAIPVFWLAQMLIFALAVQLGWFPVHGLVSPRARFTGWRLALDMAHHLVLPATALAVHHLAIISRLTRAGVLEALAQPYALAARAKGLTGRRVVLRHALRNALLPIVTVLGGQVGFMFAGAVLTESVFAWPGLGRLLLEATYARDYPILLGMFMLISAAVLLANLVTDLVYAGLDPRIHLR